MGSPTGSVKLLNVQGLRAYGAMAVVFYHTGFSLRVGLGLPIGSFGVSIFFVISGFIMALICDSNSKHFLVRRISRIVPLYWVLTLFLFLVAKLIPGLLGGTNADGISLLKSLFFVPYLSHGSYFPILFLGWSLNYEMYFYVLVAAALMIHKRTAPLLASAVMIAILIGLRVFRPEGAAMFYAHPIILEFVLGIFCYYGFRKSNVAQILVYRGLLLSLASASALLMLLAALFTVGPVNAVIVGFTSTTLVFCAVLLDKAGLSLRWPTLILLGDASYVIYLIHPYCEEALNKIVGRWLPILHTQTFVGMCAGVTITLAVSVLVYRFVDQPLHLFFREVLGRTSRVPRVHTAEPLASSD